ncbi:MAG: TIGR00730 family Rossman fold protein [Candidatus Dojkabacteria bacterium]|nr:TIGR00730 family Rossman fold protein [Candidatus Dojkabacteria bacterium]MDQ7021201.1 TIGR00730 family Rossman fold protein [Candidatus Dojkabacteria bacterium]
MKIGITLTSSMNVGQEYIDLTNNLLIQIATLNHGVVYGGTDYGMMAELAKAYKSAGGNDLTGVMAKDLMKVTKGYKAFDGLDKSFLMDTMEERKRKIIDLSDGFIVLPGGYGTFEEIGTIIGGKANKLFDKPIVLYNHNGFYNTFIEFFKENFVKQFTKVPLESIVFISDSINDSLEYLETHSKGQDIVPDKFVS